MRLTLKTLCAILLVAQTTAVVGLADDQRLRFTVPASPWALTLPAADFVLQQQQIKPDGRSGYFMLTDDKTSLNVSFFIEPAIQCKNSKACRDMVWKLGNPAWENPQNVVLSEIGDISCFEFLIPSFRGQPVRQQNLYAEFVVDDFWVDLHISKVLYKPADHELFAQLVKSIKFDYLAPNAPKDQLKETTGEDVKKFEAAIKPYIEKARQTYPEAKKRFLAGLPPKHTFFVTTRLTDDTGDFEQVFVAVREIKDGVIRGFISSEVNRILRYKKGGAYSLPESELIDWTITKPDGTEEGNFVGKFLDTYQPN